MRQSQRRLKTHLTASKSLCRDGLLITEWSKPGRLCSGGVEWCTCNCLTAGHQTPITTSEISAQLRPGPGSATELSVLLQHQPNCHPLSSVYLYFCCFSDTFIKSLMPSSNTTTSGVVWLWLSVVGTFPKQRYCV